MGNGVSDGGCHSPAVHQCFSTFTFAPLHKMVQECGAIYMGAVTIYTEDKIYLMS